MKRKNKRSNLETTMGYSMTMGGASLIASGLPAVAKTPVQTVATTGSAFVAPMAAVTGAGMAMGMLKELKPKRRRRRLK